MGSARKASRSSSSHEASPRNCKRDPSSPTPNISSQASQDLAKRTVHFSGNEWPFLGRSPYQSSLVSAESREGPQPAIIWMSEAAMLEGRFHCAQLVALSTMAALSHDSHLGNGSGGSGYDLRSITDRNQSEGSTNCSMGTNFVLAAIWPSKKLVKNSVQLSSQLAQSLCYPAVNTNIFVISVEGCCRREEIAKILFMSPYSCGKKYNVLVHECKNLILEYDLLSIDETRIDENGQGKLCAQMYLDNETEKTRKVLVALATRWLYGRLLLLGNSVTMSVCGMECNFIVKKAEAFDGKDDEKDTISNKDLNLHIEVDDILARCQSLTVSSPMQNAFCISQKTLISFISVEKSTTSVQSSISNSDKVEVNISRPKTLYSSLGGVSKQIEELKEIIDLSLLRPNILTRFGLKPTKGVLLYGPPGTGKTTLARAAVSEAGVGMFVINGPEIISEFYGQSEEALRTIFTLAENAAPSVVFIDELDAITPERKEGSESLGQRVIGTLLTLMDGGIKGSSEKVLVIAATNRPGSIDPALRRPGRFDREIEIGIPTPAGRQEILEAHLASMSHDLSSSDVQELAAGTHGFVGADLFALCNEAAMAALRRYIAKHSSVSGGTSHQIDNLGKGKGTTHSDQSRGSHNSMQSGGHKNPQVSLSIIVEDFVIARAKVRPSTMREVMLEVPKVTWQDIGGQDEIKQQLKEAVEWPQKHSDALKRIGAQPPRGVLLYGPPGCSKTLLARAVAAETGLNFLAVKGPELFKKWVGESEKAVHMLFVRAKAAAPSVIFFDEIDGLAIARDSSHGEGLSVGDRVMSQLLVELDGLTPRGGVSVIAATNRPDKLDAALLRPGRFDRLLYVGPPNEASREEIFRIHLRNTACGSDVSIENLANQTQFYTGADIEAVCHEAVMAALEESLDAEIICSRHFNHALSYVRPSAYDIDDSSYKRFTRG